jgi:Carboxypeptidase regulatory-like domain/TonB dependent receptor-like, beta-barrel
MIQRILNILWATLLILASSNCLLAQPSGIVGTVTDPSGAVVPGASIVASNVNTGIERQAVTDASGNYSIPNISAGTYQVSATKKGFQRTVVQNVVVEVQVVRQVNLHLKVGATTQEVTVTGAPAALQTQQSSVGTVEESQMVEQMPLNGRNFMQLQLLIPGSNSGAASTTFSVVKIDSASTDVGGAGFNIDGQRDVYNDYLLDGVSFKDWMHGTNTFNPSVDAIQEFRTQTSNYPAQFGDNAGGLVYLVTKSGTNELHGSLYEFLRNDTFDAANFFTNQTGGEKTPLRRSQFGGTLGGPIRHDKAFFFGSYEGFRERRGSTLIGNLPTAAMRQGDFSALLNQPSPVVINDPLTGQPFSGNIIPQNRILNIWPDYFSKYIPAPNAPGLTANYVVPGEDANDTDQTIDRIDDQVSSKVSISGHYAFSNIRDIPPSLIHLFGHTQHNKEQNAVFSVTYTPNATTVVEDRLGWNRFDQFVINNLAGTTPNIAKDIFKIQGVSTDPRSSNAPTLSASGFSNLGGAGSAPREWFSSAYSNSFMISLIRGNHTVKSGLEVIRHHETFPEIFIPNGVYSFDGTFSGYSFADLLLGVPRNFELSPQIFDPQYRYTELAPWVEDTWRVTQKLTLDLGFRYQKWTRPVSKHNSIADIRLPLYSGIASIAVAGGCVPTPISPCATSLPVHQSGERSLMQNDNTDFSPRVGFAYKINDKTVIRSAYGTFYQGEPINQWIFLSINPPFVGFWNFFVDPSQFSQFNFFNPTEGQPAGGVQFTYIPKNYRDPYLQQWNFGIERDLGRGFILTTSYVGNKDTRLVSRTWPNQPFPGPGPIDPRRPYTNVGTIAGNEPIGNANYHGLQVKLRKRYGHGLAVLAAYTWSKAITDSQTAETGIFLPNLQDNHNRKANRALFAANAPQRFSFSSIYEVPFGPGKRYLSGASGVAGKLIGGWQLGGIVTVQGGLPITETLPFDNPNVGEGAKLPDRIGNPNTGPRTSGEWFNVNAFKVPPPYTFGNAGISNIFAPPITDIDFSIYKNIPITERYLLQFRSEFYNLANHPIFGIPNTSFTTPQDGKIFNTQLNGREIQFALRLQF